jgi:mevalonate kinase
MVILTDVSATSPGKAILFGEHFVVYGYPSIIFAIDKKLRITIKFEDPEKRTNNYKNKIRIFSNLGFSAEIFDSEIIMSSRSPSDYSIVKNLNKIMDYLIDKNSNNNDIRHYNNNDITISIDSEIPIGGGLGSSSAFCVSLIGAFYRGLNINLDKKAICEKSIEIEKLIYQNTSGIDCSICTFGGLGIYSKSFGLKKLEYDIHDFPFLIIDTGISHDTFELVNRVKKIKERDIELFKKLCKEYERIFNFSIGSLENKKLESLGILMNENHSLLENLNLSNPVIDKIVNICKMGGTFGTKITGSGGGGCVLSLIDGCEQNLVNRLLKKLDELDLKYFFTTPNDDGFKFESTTSIYKIDNEKN